MAVVVQRVGLVGIARHHPHDRWTLALANDGALVNVIAVVEDEIEALVGDAPPRGEVPVLVTLAAGDREAHARHRRARGRQRAAAPDRAALAAEGELVMVIAAGLKSAHLDVHRVAELRMVNRLAWLHGLTHGLLR